MMVRLYLEVDSELFAGFGASVLVASVLVASVLAAGALEVAEVGEVVEVESFEPRESVL